MNIAGCTLLCFVSIHPLHYVTHQGIPQVADDGAVPVSCQTLDLPAWLSGDHSRPFESESDERRSRPTSTVTASAGGFGTGPIEIVVRDGRAGRDRTLDDEIGGAILATSNAEHPLNEFDRIKLPDGTVVQVIGLQEGISANRYRQVLFVGDISRPPVNSSI